MHRLQDVDYLRKSGKLAAGLRDAVCKEVKPGITTEYLDNVAAQWIKEHGAEPAFLNYRKFPKHICISVNDEIVHGVPGDRILKEGDIVGIDVGLVLDSWYGDTARTVPVGQISDENQRLINVSKESLEESIRVALPGNTIGDISYAMQSTVEAAKFTVIREYGGHGIGERLHDQPFIPCYGKKGEGLKLIPGMVLALEVMVNAGKQTVLHRVDGFTVSTLDKSNSSHFEHMVAILENGNEVLTRTEEY